MLCSVVSRLVDGTLQKTPDSSTANRKDKPIPRLSVYSWEVEFLAFLEWKGLNVVNLPTSGKLVFLNSHIGDSSAISDRLGI